jgi:hypothetical protein
MKKRISNQLTVFLTWLCCLQSWHANSQPCHGKDFSNTKSANFSFESSKTSCTNDIGLITSTKGPAAWENVTSFGSSIYLNTCSALGGLHPADNSWGSQNPSSGNGMMRVRSGPPGPGISLPEDPSLAYNYLRQELSTPLLKGITYYIEFFVSLADVSNYGANSLGIYLTKNPNDFVPQGSQTNLTHLTPQIPNVYPATTAYLDFNGWTKICGFYTPTVDGVKYFVIGNFRGTSNYSLSASTGYKGVSSNIPYYYIDDVYIGEYSCCTEEKSFQNSSSLPSKTSVNNKITAGNSILPLPVGDVVVQAGQNVNFKAGSSVNLKPGFRALVGSAFSAKIGACEKGIDDNQLKVVIQTIDLGYQITLTASVTNGSGNYLYNWSNGATTSSITVGYGSNVYSVVVTDLIQDASYPIPCNTKVGWAQYIDNCPICRASARAANSEPENTQKKVLVEGIDNDDVISVYPNPSTGIFTMRTIETMKSVTVSNSIGSNVKAISLQQQTKEIQIDLGDFPKGIYIIRILTDTGTFISKQVILK